MRSVPDCRVAFGNQYSRKLGKMLVVTVIPPFFWRQNGGWGGSRVLYISLAFVGRKQLLS